MRPQPRDDHLGGLLTAYADGSLPEEGCAFIERQLEEHPELRDGLGEIRAAQEVLRASLPAAPAGLGEERLARVLAAARQPARDSSFARRRLVMLAAACLVLSVGAALAASGWRGNRWVEEGPGFAPHPGEGTILNRRTMLLASTLKI